MNYLKAILTKLIGQRDIEVQDLIVYLNNPVGVGEHPDIIEAVEKELDLIAQYDDQLEMMNKYFPIGDDTELLKE